VAHATRGRFAWRCCFPFEQSHAAALPEQVLGKEERSLASLLRAFLAVPQDKRHQAADWRARPLPPALRTYARSDVHWLLQLADCLVARLAAEGAAGGAAAAADARERARDKRRARRRAADTALLGGLVPPLPAVAMRGVNGAAGGATTETAESDTAARRRGRGSDSSGGGSGRGSSSSSGSGEEDSSGDERENEAAAAAAAAARAAPQGWQQAEGRGADGAAAARLQHLAAQFGRLEARLAQAEAQLGGAAGAAAAGLRPQQQAAQKRAKPAPTAPAGPSARTGPKLRPATKAVKAKASQAADELGAVEDAPTAAAAAAAVAAAAAAAAAAAHPLLASAIRKSQAMTQRLWQKTPAATVVRNAASAVLRRHWQQLALQQKLREGLASGLASPVLGAATPPGLATPPPGLATPPPGLATPPAGFATPPLGPASPRGIATSPGLATPPPGGGPRPAAAGPNPDGQVLAVRDAVYALCAWRDAVARADDEGPQFVLLDAALLDLAARPPAGAGELLERAAVAARLASGAAAAGSPECPQRYEVSGPLRRDAKRLVALIADARAGLLPAPDVHGDPLLGAATGGHAGRGAGRAAGSGNAQVEVNKEERRRQRMISKFSVKSQVGTLQRGACKVRSPPMQASRPGWVRGRFFQGAEQAAVRGDGGRGRASSLSTCAPPHALARSPTGSRRPAPLGPRQVYENCRMLSADGRLLCHCDAKKLQWYVDKGIAEKVRGRGRGLGGTGCEGGPQLQSEGCRDTKKPPSCTPENRAMQSCCRRCRRRRRCCCCICER
jgi:hypothetical protein